MVSCACQLLFSNKGITMMLEDMFVGASKPKMPKIAPPAVDQTKIQTRVQRFVQFVADGFGGAACFVENFFVCRGLMRASMRVRALTRSVRRFLAAESSG